MIPQFQRNQRFTDDEGKLEEGRASDLVRELIQLVILEGDQGARRRQAGGRPHAPGGELLPEGVRQQYLGQDPGGPPRRPGVPGSRAILRSWGVANRA